ncbi:hypothetical protein I79_009758 [Cricetulus griseus]|uniref:Uncharacterized protein n=1 Tax=Cricetulus griseus TaxID=10029 RepID=G3HGM0_CRIGR|nr:hypothetical protein I79_009758 [Cricetulus griseus]
MAKMVATISHFFVCLPTCWLQPERFLYAYPMGEANGKASKKLLSECLWELPGSWPQRGQSCPETEKDPTVQTEKAKKHCFWSEIPNLTLGKFKGHLTGL